MQTLPDAFAVIGLNAIHGSGRKPFTGFLFFPRMHFPLQKIPGFPSAQYQCRELPFAQRNTSQSAGSLSMACLGAAQHSEDAFHDNRATSPNCLDKIIIVNYSDL
jgi:hypothetical protein